MSKKVRSMSEFELGQYTKTNKSSTKHNRYFSEVRQAGNLFFNESNKIEESINENSMIDRVDCDKNESNNPFENENIESFRNIKFNENTSFESGNFSNNNLHVQTVSHTDANLLKTSNSINLINSINLLKETGKNSNAPIIELLEKNSSLLKNKIKNSKKIDDKKINNPKRINKFTEIMRSRVMEKELDFIEKIENEEKEQCDNDYDANELFCKIKLEEFHCAFFTLLSIASGMIYHDLNTFGQKFYSIYKNHKDYYDMSIYISSIFVSIGVLMFSKKILKLKIYM
jgi:hypothetical protein